MSSIIPCLLIGNSPIRSPLSYLRIALSYLKAGLIDFLPLTPSALKTLIVKLPPAVFASDRTRPSATDDTRVCTPPAPPARATSGSFQSAEADHTFAASHLPA